MTIDIKYIQDTLTNIRAQADQLRLAGLVEQPDTLAEHAQTLSQLRRESTTLSVRVLQFDPDDLLGMRFFISSAHSALATAHTLYRRWELLTEKQNRTYFDDGHARVVEKHINSARRRITDFAREARESAHIALFLTSRRGAEEIIKKLPKQQEPINVELA